MRREQAWLAYAKTLGCAVLLFALNAYITLRLFRTDYTHQMGSIEAAYIGLARYASQHWNDLGWFPLWYGGIPYADTYPPLLHWICGLFLSLTGVSPGLAHHFVTATFYALGPVTLFWLAWRLCGRRACAFFAGVGYSLISPSNVLVPELRRSLGYFGPRRLENLVAYGEGPHIASLCLLALALGMLHVALTKRKPVYWIGAALAIASVPMTNWLGAMALAMGMAAYLFSRSQPGVKLLPIWLRTGALGLYAYALVVPWLSPSALATIRGNAPRVAHDYEFNVTHRLLTAGVVLVFLLAAWLLWHWKMPTHTRFAFLFLLITACTALPGYWFNLSLVPQPGRYHLEMDMAFWLAFAFVIWPLAGRLNRRIAVAVALVAVLACVPLVIRQRRAAREMERPIDIHRTIEYKTAQWLNRNLPGARVFAPGSIGFWLNAFSDSPQIGGGFDNGVTNTLTIHVIFQIFAGTEQKLAIELMRVFGVDALIVGDKDSAEVFRPISHPERFHGMTVLWRDGGDIVYDIPRRSRSLAHVMQPEDLVERRPAAYESSEMQPYLAALENPAYPPAVLRWRAPSAATVTADMRPDQILSVQISWDKGWNASVSGRPAPIRPDRLGLMAIEPKCNGPCTVELNYDGGAEGRWTRFIQRLALAGSVLWILVAAWRRRSRVTSP
ncbi:MAG: hypothetical protein ABSH50_08455 [Bryobacteraceae bacterium]